MWRVVIDDVLELPSLFCDYGFVVGELINV